MAGLRNTSRDSCDFALESERIWRDRELLRKDQEQGSMCEFVGFDHEHQKREAR